jgi:uncharacterized protein
MEQQSPMKVRLKDLPLEREIVLSNEFVRDALAGDPMRDALERPADDEHAGAAEARLSFYGEDDSVFARGTLRGWFEVACGRCVGPVRVAIDETLAATFRPRAVVPDDAPGPDGEEEVELTEDDLDLYPYDGDEIDLAPVLREQIILAVPYAPLCREDCQGLCPQCGVDRNTTSCHCEAPVDPRLAALKDIKL